MRQVEDVKIYYMTLGEIIERVEYDKANRAYTSKLTKEKKREMCYTNAIVNRARYRVSKYKREIFNKNDYEWSISQPMKICIVGDKWLIFDGQGRFEAFKDAEKNELITMEHEIPVMIFENRTLEQERKYMKENNVSNVNWNADELLRHAAVCEDENALSIMRELSDIQDELSLKSSSIPRMIMYGYDGFRKEYIGESGISPYKEYIYESFKRFYESFSSLLARVQSKVRTVQSAVALHQFFRNALKELRDVPTQAKCVELSEADKTEYFDAIAKMGQIFSTLPPEDLIVVFSGGSTLISTHLCRTILSSMDNNNRLLLNTARRIMNQA